MLTLFLYAALVVVDLIITVVLFVVAYINRKNKTSAAVGCTLGGVSLLNTLAILGGIL